MKEFKLTQCQLERSATVTMGTDGSEVTASGETEPLTMSLGQLCKHRSRYTILNLGDYDVILRRPFQNFRVVKARISVTRCEIPTKLG
eukprot:3772556-Rhodomonas_salina.1